MSYRIQYPPIRKLRGREGLRFRLITLTALSFLVFLLLVGCLWPEGAAFLRNSLPVEALDQFASKLLHGEAVMTSFYDFLKSWLHDSV